MFLTIKPTSKCNFNCSFCSAKNLNIKHPIKVPQKILDVINKIKPDDICFTGGDPLMVPPSYYEEILEKTDARIGFTTNLKDFYFNPDKWLPLFKNPRVKVCTSFQFGGGRMWNKNTAYTSLQFIKIMNLFKEKVGYMPPFISVISKENEKEALQNVWLAKGLKTQCRLNGQNCIGVSTEYYPRYKMVDLWLEIENLGLSEFEMNLDARMSGSCNFNTNLLCDSTIRSCWINQKGELIYGNCEDCLAEGLYKLEPEEEQPFPMHIYQNPADFINEKCLFCELCNFCNGCKLNRLQAKKCLEYCDEMLKRKQKIIDAGWKL